ncbi:transposase family protein, partial [Lampropedia puyangensis]
PGYVHVDIKYLPQMQDEASRSYLFVAIDRATRWVFVQIKNSKTAANAKAFLKALDKACPLYIRKILTDNGKEFTDRLFSGKRSEQGRQPTGEHEFDQLCQELGIEHRLTPVRSPQTNGMVERFNGRISQVLKSHHFHDSEDLQSTLTRYVHLYNHQFPQRALDAKSPINAMKEWYESTPELFKFKPNNRQGID